MLRCLLLELLNGLLAITTITTITTHLWEEARLEALLATITRHLWKVRETTCSDLTLDKLTLDWLLATINGHLREATSCNLALSKLTLDWLLAAIAHLWKEARLEALWATIATHWWETTSSDLTLCELALDGLLTTVLCICNKSCCSKDCEVFSHGSGRETDMVLIERVDGCKMMG